MISFGGIKLICAWLDLGFFICCPLLEKVGVGEWEL